MKIVDNTTSPLREFKLVNRGRCFRYKGGDTVYIKTTFRDGVNAVSLRDGGYAYISGNEEVELLEAEVHIL